MTLKTVNSPRFVSTWMPVLLVACLAWLLYARMLGADFVWDARAKVLWSDFIHNPANLGDVLSGRVIAHDVLDNNRPGNLLSLMMDAAVWGRNPLGYHLTSITLHAVVCAMLCVLVLRLLPEGEGNTWPAGLAALWFAVHPLNCEPVSEVSYREDLLVAASILVALFAAMGFLGRIGFWRNAGLGLVCCGALLFGVSAKENGAAGPVVLAAYWWLWRRGERRGFWLVGVGAAVVAGFLWARFALAPTHSVIFTEHPSRISPTFFGTLQIQQRIWAMEFSQVVLPHDLCADYGPSSLRYFNVWISLPVILLLIFGQVLLGLRHRVIALGAVWYWAGLIPVSNFVPIYRPMADRFMYVPLLGMALMLAQGLRLAARLRPDFRMTIYAVAGVWICSAGVMTFNREAIWHDSLALWQGTLEDNPLSSTAADNLGWALFSVSRNDEAAAAFKKAILLTQGHDADPWAGLALTDAATGDAASAATHYERAVSLDTRFAHPQELVAALTLEPDNAGKLELLAGHNTKR